MESINDIRAIYPNGDNVFIAKDPNEPTSPGGIIIPDKHQVYKRRGWCLVPGGGEVRN